MRSFIHINARTLNDALRALAEYNGKARLNAGGTDLIGVLKDGFLTEAPKAVVNIKTIPDLDGVDKDEGGLKIGALARLSDLANSPTIKGGCRVLAEAARAVGSPQIRNVATIGGNLCQDIRCWYYRYPRHIGGPIQCLRKGSGPCLAVKGDNRYHAVMGGKKCFAVCPSDTAVALAALNAQIIIADVKGERKVAVTEFYHPIGNELQNTEMVKAIEIPDIPGETRQAFLKFTLRESIDFAIVSVASIIAVENGICTDARIALGAVAPSPIRAKTAEKLIVGQPIDKDLAHEAARLALEKARPLSRNAYKVEIAQTLVERAILGQVPANP
ncbi:MAG: xanthine dehydrogenase family protein subunit M [Deltaproteobacteria bacterium]|nr:xanthine dehydrogenase family protein subunit M [Deltaproteobacteria bacterium]MBW1818322.1 xanthine dehydrogenase family protein subunit M [Deltaproteobacteria bacterium]